MNSETTDEKNKKISIKQKRKFKIDKKNDDAFYNFMISKYKKSHQEDEESFDVEKIKLWIKERKDQKRKETEKDLYNDWTLI